MTRSLEKAIAALQKLPPTEQDAIAALIFDELADEAKWDASFAKSQDKLVDMAKQARNDIAAGRVKELGIDEL